MKRVPISKDNRGLTLIELIIGITILTIIAVPLLRSFLTSATTARRSELYSNATEVAQNIIEEIESTDVDDFIKDNNATFNSTSKTYTINQLNVSSSNYDAIVTLSTEDSANDKFVAYGNSMDALIDMNIADDMALEELASQLDGLRSISPEPTLSNLTRRISITATNEAGTDNYKLDVVFNYFGSFIGRDADGNTYNVVLNHDVKGSSRAKSSSSFSLYLFFKANYSGRDTISISNPNWNTPVSLDSNETKDFKVFLVNSTAGDPPISYRADISYYYQTDSLKRLVFTNLPASTYKGFNTDNVWKQDIPISGYLVEQKTLNRLYEVTVSVYENGKSATDPPLASLSTIKLN